MTRGQPDENARNREAKAEPNPILSQLHGKIGDVVFKQYGDSGQSPVGHLASAGSRQRDAGSVLAAVRGPANSKAML
jgi:hypothetical protein